MASNLPDCRTASRSVARAPPAASASPARSASPPKAPPWCSPIATRAPGPRRRRRLPAPKFVGADVSRKADVDALVAQALARHGRVDVLVNNAGITHACDFLELAEEDFDRVLAVNLKSMFLCGQAVARAMVKEGARGSIVNMSSANAVVAIPNQVPYVVSKGGINQLTKVMAVALAPHGIRVNAIGPGTILTELSKARC